MGSNKRGSLIRTSRARDPLRATSLNRVSEKDAKAALRTKIAEALRIRCDTTEEAG